MNKKRRIEYIDIAKGIAMLLIVIQHVLTYYPQKLQVLEPFFSGFRVPVFLYCLVCFLVHIQVLNCF